MHKQKNIINLDHWGTKRKNDVSGNNTAVIQGMAVFQK